MEKHLKRQHKMKPEIEHKILSIKSQNVWNLQSFLIRVSAKSGKTGRIFARVNFMSYTEIYILPQKVIKA